MQPPLEITHRPQETAYSCAAACLAMVLNRPEAEIRKAARTTRKGTSMRQLKAAAEANGCVAHFITLPPGLQYESCVWWLDSQSRRWPLILSCTFRSAALDRIDRVRTLHRRHAVVLWQGQVYDPSEDRPYDMECVGHTGDRGILLNQYLLIESTHETHQR